MLRLERVKRTHKELNNYMAIHYSQPKGFVGRNVCYLIYWNRWCHGAIVGGSATKHLPGRKEYCINLLGEMLGLCHIVNNIFFHIEGPYKTRNFGQKVLGLYRQTIQRDWAEKYGDVILLHESLVEPPRTGEVYRRDGWNLVGQTKGYTAKRVAGYGTDDWSGKRVWDTENLRPKLVFVRGI